jgi:hypothetical protein
MRFLYAALLIFFLSLGCSKTSTEPRFDEPMLTPIEDLGFSHDAEEDDGEWDDLEKVYAKFTAQWYVDPDDPEMGWNTEQPGYVLREREVFLDGVCSLQRDVKSKRDDGEWLIYIYGPDFNFEGDGPPGDFFLYVNKNITDGKPWYNISWNTKLAGSSSTNPVVDGLSTDDRWSADERR